LNQVLDKKKAAEAISKMRLWEPISFIVMDDKLYRTKNWFFWMLLFFLNGFVPAFIIISILCLIFHVNESISLFIGTIFSIVPFALIQHFEMKIWANFSLIVSENGTEAFRKLPWVSRMKFFGASFTTYFCGLLIVFIWCLLAIAVLLK